MGIIDAIVLVGYLLGITALGIWMARRVHNRSDFFMPRRFGKATMIMHAFGSGTASDQAGAVVSGTFQYGVAGIWLQWQWMFATPFYWLIAPIMRRFRAVTTADVPFSSKTEALREGLSLVALKPWEVQVEVPPS